MPINRKNATHLHIYNYIIVLYLNIRAVSSLWSTTVRSYSHNYNACCISQSGRLEKTRLSKKCLYGFNRCTEPHKSLHRLLLPEFLGKSWIRNNSLHCWKEKDSEDKKTEVVQCKLRDENWRAWDVSSCKQRWWLTQPTYIELHTVSLQGHLCSELVRWIKIKM